MNFPPSWMSEPLLAGKLIWREGHTVQLLFFPFFQIADNINCALETRMPLLYFTQALFITLHHFLNKVFE